LTTQVHEIRERYDRNERADGMAIPGGALGGKRAARRHQHGPPELERTAQEPSTPFTLFLVDHELVSRHWIRERHVAE
jgi:hypothetical protein